MNRINSVSGIVDCHTHCGGVDIYNLINQRYPSNQHVSVLNSTMLTQGIDYAIVFPMPSTFYFNTALYCKQGLFIPSGLEDVPYGVENLYLLNEINAFEFDRILPFLSISVRDRIKEQCASIREHLVNYNVYGLKLHTLADQTSIRCFFERGKEFVELLSEYKFPLIFHAECLGVSEPLAIFDFADKHPEIRFSLAHFAGLNADFFDLLEQYNKNYDNVFFDCSPCINICAHQLAKEKEADVLDLEYNNPKDVLTYFIERFPDNILWGTDSPWVFTSSIETKIAKAIDYSDERKLLTQINQQGLFFRETTVNKFIFGKSAFAKA